MLMVIQRYLVQAFLKHFGAIFTFISALIFAVEALELYRRIGALPQVSLLNVLYLSLLKLPQTIQILLPFIFLFAGMTLFSTLTKYKELVVMRAAGMSAFKIMMPVILTAFIVGLFYLFIANPIFATMSQKFKTKRAQLVDAREEIIDITGKGVWIRDGGEEKEAYFLHASRMQKREKKFFDVTFYRYEDGVYQGRLDADEVVLHKGYWLLPSAKVTPLIGASYGVENHTIASTLKLKAVTDYLLEPDMLSFWQLSNYVDQLESHGFKSDRYRLYYQALLAKPFLFMGMVMFAGIFSFQRTRLGQRMHIIVGGIAGGLALFFLDHMMLVLGMSQKIPLFIAAWGATYAVLALSIIVFSKIEE